MKNLNKFIAILCVVAMTLSLCSVSVFAAADDQVDFVITLDKTTIAPGESAIVSIATNVDYTIGDYSAIEWKINDNFTYEANVPDGDIVFTLDNVRDNIVFFSLDKQVSAKANEPFYSFKITANSDLAEGQQTIELNACNIVDSSWVPINATSSDIVVTIGDGGDTPDPTPTATAAPVETAKPTATAAPTDAPEANRVTVNVGTAIVGRDFTITVNRTDASEEATVEVTLTPAKEGAAPVTKTVTFAAGETKLTVTIPSDEMENIAENGESFDVNVVYNGSEEPIEKSSTATMRKGGSSTGNSGYTTGSDGVIGGSTPKPGPSTDDTTEPTEAPVVTTEPSNVVFEDVPATYWGYDYIMDLYENGIVNGTTATLFMPEANVTRAEFTKMAAGIFGLTATSTVSQFTDVPAGEWFTPYVIAASEAGIVQGVSETEFAPNDNVTREQMAAIIGRQLGTTSTAAITFTDAASIEDYARPYVAALAEAGYLTGDETGAFNPKNNATRAEAAALLDRVYVDLTVAEPTEAPEATEEPEEPEVTAEPEATAEVEATEAPEATETPAE